MDKKFNEIYVKDVIKILFTKTIITYVKTKDPNTRNRSTSTKMPQALSISTLILSNISRLQDNYFFTEIYITIAEQLYDILMTDSKFLTDLRRFYYNVS